MYKQKKANGTYQYFESFLDPLTGQKKRISVTVSTQDDIKAGILLKQKWEQMQTPLPVTGNVRLKDLCAAYNADCKARLKPQTAIRNEFEAKGMMKLLGANTLVDRLNAGMIKTALANADKDNGWRNERIKRWSAILRFGYQNDYIQDVRWLDKIQRFPVRSHRSTIKDKYLESEELQALLDGMNVPYWKDLTLFLSLSGLRVGEALALNKTDLDTKGYVIHVTKTLNNVTKDIGTPKSDDSFRDVPMSEELFALCSRLRKGNTAKLKTMSVFPRQYDAYRAYLAENSQRILGRRITPHTLRHTFCSLAAEKGIPLETVSRILGHADSDITRKIYLHATKKVKEKDAALIRNVQILG